MIETLIFSFDLFTHFLLFHTFLVVSVPREGIHDISNIIVFQHRERLTLFNNNLITNYTEILAIMHLIFASFSLELLELREPVSVIHFHLITNKQNQNHKYIKSSGISKSKLTI